MFLGFFEADTSFCLAGDEHDVFVDLVIVCDVDVVLAGYTVHLREKFLDLAREHIDAVYLEHVVASTLDNVNTRVLLASLTVAAGRYNTRDIVCTETDERSPLLDKCCDYDLALFSVRHGLAGLRIDDLNVNIIIPIMDCRLARTVILYI